MIFAAKVDVNQVIDVVLDVLLLEIVLGHNANIVQKKKSVKKILENVMILINVLVILDVVMVNVVQQAIQHIAHLMNLVTLTSEPVQHTLFAKMDLHAKMEYASKILLMDIVILIYAQKVQDYVVGIINVFLKQLIFVQHLNYVQMDKVNVIAIMNVKLA